MNERIPSNVQNVRTALLEKTGHTSIELRSSVEAAAAAMSGRSNDAGSADDAPEKLAPYIEKIARLSYKITDEDVEDLLRAGYTEDEVFEVTLSAAFGASVARMECGLRALAEASRS